jgi:hypothetical protein
MGRRIAIEEELLLCKTSESDNISMVGSTMSSKSRK